MNALSVVCPGCGALVPASDGPTHRYLGAAPGCWARFGELLAEQYGPTGDPGTLRLAVDAYAAQHPGIPSPQSTRSVAFHLTRLCLVLEHGLEAALLPPSIGGVLDRFEPLPWLDPPSHLGPVTVYDIPRQGTSTEQRAAMERWASSVWQAWSPHHPTVRRWAGWSSLTRNGGHG
jgi:hypothetical protein